MHTKSKGLGIVAIRLAILVLVLQSLANATFPGRNGRIAFLFHGDLYSINPDGTGLQQLTNFAGSAYPFWLHWSPDGRQIVFELDPVAMWIAPKFSCGAASDRPVISAPHSGRSNPS